MKHNEVIKNCRILAKEQNLTFRRSKKISTINGKTCYEIESGIQYKTLQQDCISTIYATLYSGSLANQ